MSRINGLKNVNGQSISRFENFYVFCGLYVKVYILAATLKYS